MKLKKLDSSHDLLVTNHGHEILYANDTPVAGYWPVTGYYKAHSAELTGQVSKYLSGKAWRVLPDSMIERMGFIIAEESGLTEY